MTGDGGAAARLRELVDDLCRTLSGSTPDARGLADRLGTVVEDDGTMLAVDPAEPILARASVVGEGDAPPDYVTLELAESQEVEVAELDGLGERSELARVDWDRPRRLQFWVDRPGAPYTCAVIVRLREQDDDDGPELVDEVTVRRDERVD